MERLQEQLQLERDKKSALEAGLKMSKGNQPIPEIADEKVGLLLLSSKFFFVWLKYMSNLKDMSFLQLKKDLQDVAQAETDIANLEHKVDDLENRLIHQDAKASASMHGASKEPRSIPESSAKL